MESTNKDRQVFAKINEKVEEQYKWTLHDFSAHSDSTPVGEAIISPKFSSEEDIFKSIEWQLELYPKGNHMKNTDHVGVFIHSLYKYKVTIDFEISVSSDIKMYRSIKFSHTFENESDWGYLKFIQRNILLQDLKKGNGALTLEWKIKYLKNLQLKNYQINIYKQFGSLLETKEHCDVTLISNDGSGHEAHKAILSCRSKVFAAKFKDNTKETQEDVDNETLKEILQFIYTGKLKNKQNNAKNVLIAADKYELNDLKQICIHHLCDTIQNDNVLELFEFAHTYSLCQLKEEAKKYFLENSKSVVCTKGLENLKDILQDSISCLLYELALHKSKSSDSNSSDNDSDS